MKTMHKKQLSDKEFLALGIPFMLSTVTQPLLGAVDTAVAGRLETAAAIAGIAVGSNIFNTLYWMFGFLRVSTTAYSAQAMGKKCQQTISIAFFRPILMALVVALLLLIFQVPLLNGILILINPEDEVRQMTASYYRVLIWGAPFVLGNYVILGWLMGQRRIKSSMTMQISGNLINICLSIVFALVLEYGVLGIAVATLMSQIIATGLGLFFLNKSKQIRSITKKQLFDKKAWLETMKVNEYLMKRTACLLVHNNAFVAVGARFGTTLLAVNGILFQLNSITSYLFDGLANAASVYTGKAVGEENEELIEEVSRLTMKWTLILAGGILVIYALFQSYIFGIFTPIESVLEGLRTYRFWLFVYPLIAGLGLSIYGIFTGSGQTKSVFMTTLQSLVGFFVVLLIAVPLMKNHGLWLALMTFYGLRSLLLVSNIKLVVLKKGI